ncbi:MAG: type II secretion system protein GspE, partial [Pseudomonadota bacterium]
MAASENELAAQNDALAPDPDAAIETDDQPKVSFTFARRNGLFIEDYADGRALVVCRPGLSHHALAEVRRFAGMPLRLKRVDADNFSSLLQAAYEGGSNRAMEMVEGLDDGDTDLFTVAQALPEPSDLLESDDDAPIIR